MENFSNRPLEAMAYKRTRLVIIFSLVAALFTAGNARAQNARPLYLDARPGEDPFLIDVTEMAQRYPKPAVREYQKAMDEARKGKLAAAAAHLEEAIHLAPEFFSAHNSLGVLYQKMERYRDAQREYDEAHRLNLRSAAPLVNLGSLYIEESVTHGGSNSFAGRSKLNDALSSLNAALEIQPSSPFGHYLTGIVYDMTGFYEEALHHFERALESGAGLGWARLALANTYMKMQEWKNVVLQLDAYLEEYRFASNRPWVKETRALAALKVKELNQ
jgi:tetratricopeptide (TPR) repeat protein